MSYRPAVLPLASAFLLCLVPLESHGQEGSGGVVLTSAEIGEAYYDEPPAALVAVEAWIGLYVTEDGARLKEPTVEFVAQPDGNFTVYALTANPPGPRLLFSGVDALSPGPIVEVQSWPQSLWTDGAVVELRLGDDLYRVGLEAADPGLCDAVVRLEASGRAQRLYGSEDATSGCDEPHFSVDWAGDLDRDGRLDLVVGLASKYSHHPRLLLLSSAAGPDELVAPVAQLNRTAG